jgi:hypothetical protein
MLFEALGAKRIAARKFALRSRLKGHRFDLRLAARLDERRSARALFLLKFSGRYPPIERFGADLFLSGSR